MSSYHGPACLKTFRGGYVFLPRDGISENIQMLVFPTTTRQHENIQMLVCMLVCPTISREESQQIAAWQLRGPTTTRNFCTQSEVSSLRQDESSKRGYVSQQIAAYQLLHRVKSHNQTQGSSADGRTVAAEAGWVTGPSRHTLPCVHGQPRGLNTVVEMYQNLY
jgi:hypothetical protein